MALECAETWTTETRCVLSNLLCCVIRNSPTGSVVELRENVALGTRLARKLRDCLSFDSNTVYNTFHDALKELQTLVKTPSQEETGRSTNRGCSNDWRFVVDGIPDITEENSAPVQKRKVMKMIEIRYHADKSGSSLPDEPDATSGRKCEAAASLVGFDWQNEQKTDENE